MIKLASSLSLALLLIFTNLSAQTGSHSRVKVSGSVDKLIALSKTGLPLDHLIEEGPGYFIGEFSKAEIDEIRQNGLQIENLIPDLKKHYRDQNIGLSAASYSKTAAAPVNFKLGTMGGYLTWDEAIAELDSMRLLFPNLISVKDSIGESFEGRPIWAVRISDNPDINENEPEVLYDALHHAREPMSLMQMIYYMWWLLENEGSDPEASFLISNREMYFVPVINPDGYVYNQSTDPNGGGLWRKNRRPIGTEFGVDLNRNYGFQWAYDNQGSSPNPADGTYRGAAPFSEPETQAMRDYCNAHDFKTAFNYHSYGNLLIYPWGYIPAFFTPDSAQFVDMGVALTEQNSYVYGTGDQTVGYSVNGSSDDWMYGEQNSKGKIFSFTPEVGEGNDGFWPPLNKIEGYCEDNLQANIRLALMAGDYIDAVSLMGPYVSTTSVWVPAKFTNLGTLASQPVSSVFTSSDPNIVSVNNNLSLGVFTPYQSKTDSFSLTLASGISDGTLLEGTIVTTFASGITVEDEVSFRFGEPVVIWGDSAEGTPLAWNGGWNRTTEKAFSGAYSFTDSPFSDYSDDDFNQWTMTNPVSLSGYIIPMLRYKAQWDVESGWDYVQVAVSTDGIGFTALEGLFTSTGGGFFQPTGSPVYDGSQSTWVDERIDLSPWDGQDIQIAFWIHSDFFQERDGFYFDELQITGYPVVNGVEGGAAANTAFLFPNPSHGSMHVKGEIKPGESLVKVYSLQGKILYETEIAANKKLNLEHLPSGSYLVRIGQQSPQKIVLLD